MKKQVYNPFLPLWEYVPDGEPHVFGNRIYLFGSHDVEGGGRYCAAGNYVGWSASVSDLADWRYEGVIYESKQDPRAEGEFTDLYAPDVVQGNDGRYYLYYCLSGGIGSTGDDHNTAIGVAVCDSPAGKYKYYGFVRNQDGSPYLHYLPGDPAVINDDGVIRLYHGWALSTVASGAHGGGSGAGQGQPGAAREHAGMDMKGNRQMPDFKALDKEMRRQFLLGVEQMLFHRTKEQLMADPEDVMGANHVTLGEDMLTVTSFPTRIIPSQFMALGTSFEGHGFYEASSIRKINGIYYFIYSDENSNMLSYATSRYPDRDFVYGGILQSNGDVGLDGRKGEDRLNMTANNHGSLERIKGQWYIFYHRHTHNSTYSRQACAEPVEILPDGSIGQAECTSCGLNGGPLLTEGEYPAVIACNITNGRMPHATNRIVDADIPYITHRGSGKEAERYITNIKAGTRIVWKYFAFSGVVKLTLVAGGTGAFLVSTGGIQQGKVTLSSEEGWQEASLEISMSGTVPLELCYEGEGIAELLAIRFEM